MNLFLYGLNYSPELTGIGKYNGEMAPWFVEQGHDVSVVCAPPYYPEWKVHKGYGNKWFSRNVEKGVEVVRCPLYVPSKPSTIKRLLHLSSFAFTSSIALFKKVFQKPDVVIVVEPTLFTVPAALLFCRLAGAKSVLHIQDFEVDAMFGLGMGQAGAVSRLAFVVERWLMRRFDKVSTISYSMVKRAESKGVDSEKLMFFPNWSDTEFVTPEVDGADFRKAWGFSEADKVVLYAGNIGAKQGLELVLQAAEHYKDQENIHFVMVGAGAHCEVLKDAAQKQSLSNIQFKPLQAWEDVPAMLSMADVHLVVQKKGAADAVLPSKLTNILSSGGNALVTAEADTELGVLATNYPGIYQCVEPECLPSFIAGLNKQLELPEGHNQIARKYAEEHLNRGAILARFAEDVSQLVSNQNLSLDTKV